MIISLNIIKILFKIKYVMFMYYIICYEKKRSYQIALSNSDTMIIKAVHVYNIKCSYFTSKKITCLESNIIIHNV